MHVASVHLTSFLGLVEKRYKSGYRSLYRLLLVSSLVLERKPSKALSKESLGAKQQTLFKEFNFRSVRSKRFWFLEIGLDRATNPELNSDTKALFSCEATLQAKRITNSFSPI